FFFQAEDGIRDFHVTGVQTCALPISSGDRWRSSRAGRAAPSGRDRGRARWRWSCAAFRGEWSSPSSRERGGRPGPRGSRAGAGRSEERRVGKECRSRGGAGSEKEEKL